MSVLQVPIVEHLPADPPTALRKKAEQLAETLLREHPELAAADDFRDLVPEELGNGPTLHLDDCSEISRLEPRRGRPFLSGPGAIASR